MIKMIVMVMNSIPYCARNTPLHFFARETNLVYGRYDTTHFSEACMQIHMYTFIHSSPQRERERERERERGR